MQDKELVGLVSNNAHQPNGNLLALQVDVSVSDTVKKSVAHQLQLEPLNQYSALRSIITPISTKVQISSGKLSREFLTRDQNLQQTLPRYCEEMFP